MTNELLESLDDQARHEAVMLSTEDEVNRRAAMLAPERADTSEAQSDQDDSHPVGWHPDARSRKAAPPSPWTPWRGGGKD